MMKIGYFADGPWSHNAIQNIVDSELFKIVFILKHVFKCVLF